MSSRCNQDRLHGVHTRCCPVLKLLMSCHWTPSSQSGAAQAARCSPWEASSKRRASLQVAPQQLRSVLAFCCRMGLPILMCHLLNVCQELAMVQVCMFQQGVNSAWSCDAPDHL